MKSLTVDLATQLLEERTPSTSNSSERLRSWRSWGQRRQNRAQTEPLPASEAKRRGALEGAPSSSYMFTGPEDAGRGAAVAGRVSSKSSRRSAMLTATQRTVEAVRSLRSEQLRQQFNDVAVTTPRRATQDSDSSLKRCSTSEILVVGSYFPVLRAVGILPWDRHVKDSRRMCLRPALWFQWAVLLLVLCACLLEFKMTCMDHWTCVPNHFDRDGGFSTRGDLPMALAAVLGLLSVGAPLGSPQLCSCVSIILRYLDDEGFLPQWKRAMLFAKCVTMLIFACACGMRFYIYPEDHLGIVTFVIVNAVLSGLTIVCLYVSNALAGLLDLFANGVVTKERILDAVGEWSMLEALLRKASGTIEWCLFVLQGAVALHLLFSTFDVIWRGLPPWHLAPGALMTMNILRAFIEAAQVTDQCIHMPSLINFLDFGEEMDVKREYVVHYMRNSAAGFYIFGVRLTTVLVLKMVYLGTAVIFTLLMRHFEI